MGILADATKKKESEEQAKLAIKTGGKKFASINGKYLGGHPDYPIKSNCFVVVNEQGIIITSAGGFSMLGIIISANSFVEVRVNTNNKNTIELIYTESIQHTILLETKQLSLLTSGIAKMRSLNPRQYSSDSVVFLGSADEIMKFKQLLDAGAITLEEYDTKKKQLLGI